MSKPTKNQSIEDPLQQQVDRLFERVDQKAHAVLAGMLAMVRLGDETFPSSKVSAERGNLKRADRLIGYTGSGSRQDLDETDARLRVADQMARDRELAREMVQALSEDLGEGRTGGASVAESVGRLTLGPFTPEVAPAQSGNGSQGRANGFAVHVDGALPLAPIPTR